MFLVQVVIKKDKGWFTPFSITFFLNKLLLALRVIPSLNPIRKCETRRNSRFFCGFKPKHRVKTFMNKLKR